MEIPEGVEGSGDFLVGEGNHRGKVFFEVIRTLEGGSYYKRNHRKQREKCCGFSLLPVLLSLPHIGQTYWEDKGPGSLGKIVPFETEKSKTRATINHKLLRLTIIHHS